MKLADLIDFNPRTPIPKSDQVQFIDMAALPIMGRDIGKIDIKAAGSSGAKFKNGDTLLARITPCLENGKGGRVSGLSGSGLGQGSTEFIVMRAKQKSDENFVYYLSRHPEFRSYAIQHMSGTSGRQRVSWQPLAEFEIDDLVPGDRVAAGEVLSYLDDKIGLNRRMNETLEGLAQAIFKDWFVDFGPTRRKQAGATDVAAILGGLISDLTQANQIAALFPNSFGDDGLPEGWSLKQIGSLVEVAGGSTPSTSDASLWEPAEHWWATPKDLSSMSDLALFSTDRRISDAGLASITSNVLPVGTVLLSSRAPIGYLAIAQVPVSINQGFIGLKPKEAFGSAYLYLWCKANMEKIVANANGSTFQEISKKNFRPISSPLPDSFEVVTSFGVIAQPLLDRIVLAAKENRTLAEARDYLLPKLMSGEVRVRDVEKVGADE